MLPRCSSWSFEHETNEWFSTGTCPCRGADSAAVGGRAVGRAVGGGGAGARGAHWLTATAAHLPFADGGFDCVLSMFALTAGAEFFRVLRPGGIFVQVLAGQGHLPGLKSIIYPAHVEKEKTLHPALPGFGLLHTQTLRFSFSLPDAQSVHDLLYMTPHVWRITKRGAEALAQTAQLTDTAEVIFNIYGRQEAGNLLE